MNTALSSTVPFRRTADAAAFADTLNGLDAGLYLLDTSGYLIHTNTAGQALLDAGDVLYEIRGHLACCDLAAHRTLRQILAAAGHGAGRDGGAVPMTGLHAQRYVAHVLPLASVAHRHAGVAIGPVAAMFVREVAPAAPPRSDVIAKAFNLTPTELRVLLAIVELGGIPEVAASLGIACTTVKTHVRHLFEKTGTARQADFVKLVAAYATPLRDVGATR